MYESPYGKPDGLAPRLRKWAKDLAANTTYPWVGLGLLADLELAADMLEGKPTEAPAMEFDL